MCEWSRSLVSRDLVQAQELVALSIGFNFVAMLQLVKQHYIHSCEGVQLHCHQRMRSWCYVIISDDETIPRQPDVVLEYGALPHVVRWFQFLSENSGFREVVAAWLVQAAV